MLLFITVIVSSANLCKSNPSLFKLIKDIHYKKIHENQDKNPDVSHYAYSTIKSACKSNADPYKSNFPCGKFLFNCQKCEVRSKFK